MLSAASPLGKLWARRRWPTATILSATLLPASTAQASATFTYDDRDALRTLTRSNGVSTDYELDPAGRILSIKHSAGRIPPEFPDLCL